MCGIYVVLGYDRNGESRNLPKSIIQYLKARGPDGQSFTRTQISGSDISSGQEEPVGSNFQLCFHSSVLSLRGSHTTIQPIVDSKTGSILCWNGEAWNINNKIIQGAVAVAGLKHFASCATPLLSGEHATTDHHKSLTYRGRLLEAYTSLVCQIQGPFAFVFYDISNRFLLYGRDPLGRRSLLSRTDDTALIISSVCGEELSNAWAEVEPGKLFIVDLLDLQSQWQVSTELKEAGNESRRPENPIFVTDSIDPTGSGPSSIRFNSVRNINKSNPLPSTTTITLSSHCVAQLHNHLIQSLRLRILGVPSRPPQNISLLENKVKIAVLFSGGLDCTVLARLANDILPEDETIDLLNVAFENPRIAAASQNASNAHSRPLQNLKSDSPYDLCPDRRTAQTSYASLLSFTSQSRFRLVKIDIPYALYLSHLPTIKSLIFPHNTEMDLSIGAALYFASRGIGYIDTEENIYATPARVLLSGLGADELFGGYSRHTRAFERGGHDALIAELALDFERIGKRNLGRDDRVISHWGREARYPFLDENLVRWALDAPIWEKCDFGVEDPEVSQGEDIGSASLALEPGKKVLRVLAHKLGMPDVAREKKRAIQFGARTAKMQIGRVKGTQTID